MSDTPDCIHVVALVVPKQGKRREVQTILLELVEATRREEGCIQYDLLEETNNPTDFTFVERWATKAALDAHFVRPHFTLAAARLEGLLIAPPDIMQLKEVR